MVAGEDLAGFSVPTSPFASGRFGPRMPFTLLLWAMYQVSYQLQIVYACDARRLLKVS